MTPITSLVLPILVAAVVVFVLSLIVQMAMPWHKTDFDNVPDDDEFLGAIRQLNIPPGDYTVPSPRLPNGARNPDFVEKLAKGPSVTMTVIPPSDNMGRYMVQWFAFTLLVAVIAGWVTGTIVGTCRRSPRVLPLRGDHHLPLLLARRLAALDMVPSQVVHRVQERTRRDPLRCRDGDGVQLAVARMKRVTGIGGIFFKAKDAPALQAWYKRHLGIDVQEWGGTAFTWTDA